MEELFISNNKLIPEQEWIEKIEMLERSVNESSEPYNELKQKVKQSLVEAVKKRFQDNSAILFSGGVDSSTIALIAKILGKKFCCYTAGFKDSNFKMPEDVLWAKRVAKKLGFNLKVNMFNLKEIEKVFEKTVRILGENTNVVNVGVGGVIMACSEIIEEKVVFSGLGSEEIFAGYDRHRKNPSNKECWDGLKNMHKRDFLRDTAIAGFLKVSLKTPFLDQELIKSAMAVSFSHKIKDELTKIILRDVAFELGLPKEFAYRPKRAAQYGSSFDRALKKLAKTNKFIFKKDYLESLKKI